MKLNIRFFFQIGLLHVSPLPYENYVPIILEMLHTKKWQQLSLKSRRNFKCKMVNARRMSQNAVIQVPKNTVPEK